MYREEEGSYNDKTDPFSSHTRIKSILRNLAKGTRILDIGTASGTLGRMCQDQELLFFGIEPNKTWLDLARPYYQDVLESKLEDAPDDYLLGYDVIVCADILEHLVYPLDELRRLVNLQVEDSFFIISVPNVANLWIRLSLLFGNFTYTDKGILDKTHLHFFTKRSFLEMLDNAGLQIIYIKYTPVPLNLVHPKFKQKGFRVLHRLLAILTNLFPTLLAYQFIVVSEKYSNEPDKNK